MARPVADHQSSRPAQFNALYWPDTPNYKRAYSLSSNRRSTRAQTVTVKRDSKMGTRIVDWAKPGDQNGRLGRAVSFK